MKRGKMGRKRGLSGAAARTGSLEKKNRKNYRKMIK